MAQVSYQSYVEVARWADAGRALVECARDAGVHIELRESKGLARTTFYYTVSGEELRVLRFKLLWRRDLDKYENRHG